MNNSFNSQILSEKLSKLNNTQQSIETLSHWCIFHRKKAKLVVETWEKLFISSPKDQRVPFLYLANDILQNSRRKGSEFVNVFWKVLPGALKSVYENGDDHGKSAIMRLVDIWDERKVFGSRGQGLKEDILGKTPPPFLDSNGKSSEPIKVVRKDPNSIRIKLTVGGMLEKIVTAYQSVLDEHFNEDTALNTCKAAVHHVEKMEKDVYDACTQGIQQGLPLMKEIQEQEIILKQCIEQLESVEVTRTSLVIHLKEALQEQESKLELIRTQLQVAQAEIEHVMNTRQRLSTVTTSLVSNPNKAITSPPAEATPVTEPNPHIQRSTTPPPESIQPLTSFVNSSSVPPPQPSQPLTSFMNLLSTLRPQSSQPMTSFVNSSSAPLPPQSSQPMTPFSNSSTTLQTQSSQPMTSFANSVTTLPLQQSQPATSFVNSLSAEEQHKKAAADIAARLSASTSSAQVLTSVLSSLVAEEAASMNGGLSSGVFTGSPPIFTPEKRPKLEKPMSVSETTNAYFGLPPPQLSTTNMQSPSQASRPPPPFPPPPRPLPPPPPPPPVQQYGSSPYGFGGSPLPPTSTAPMGISRPSAPPPLPPTPFPRPQQQPQQQQHSAATVFHPRPGIGFYGQLQTAPPVPIPRGTIAGQGSST